MRIATILGFTTTLLLAATTWFGEPYPLVVSPTNRWGWLVAARSHWHTFFDSYWLFAMLTGTGTLAWLLLLNRPGSRRREVYLLWLLPLLFSFPWGSGDMYNYCEQGWNLLHGHNPSLTPAGSVPENPYSSWSGGWAGTRVGYQWTALALSALSAAFGGSHPALTLFSLRLWPILGLVIIYLAIKPIARTIGICEHNARWLILANPVMLWHGVGGGHNDVIAVAFTLATLASALVLTSKPRVIALGVPITLALIAIWLKPLSVFLLAAYPYLANRSRKRAPWILQLSYCAGAAIAPLILAILASGIFPGGYAWLRADGIPGRFCRNIIRDLEAISLVKTQGIPHSPGAYGWIVDNVSLLTVICPLALALLLLLREPRGKGFSVAARVTIAALILGPAFYPWYTIVLIPALGLLKRPLHYRGLAIFVVIVMNTCLSRRQLLQQWPHMVMAWAIPMATAFLGLLLVRHVHPTECGSLD